MVSKINETCARLEFSAWLTGKINVTWGGVLSLGCQVKWHLVWNFVTCLPGKIGPGVEFCGLVDR